LQGSAAAAVALTASAKMPLQAQTESPTGRKILNYNPERTPRPSSAPTATAGIASSTGPSGGTPRPAGCVHPTPLPREV